MKKLFTKPIIKVSRFDAETTQTASSITDGIEQAQYNMIDSFNSIQRTTSETLMGGVSFRDGTIYDMGR